MSRLKDLYKSKVVDGLKEKFNYTNPMSVPQMEKIVLSMGLGRAVMDKKIVETAVKDAMKITGQRPVICKAKRSVSNFKLREGMEIGIKVTLRRDRMYEFMDRLINLAIPRVKDFRGLSPKSFDGRGNYSMGITEQTVFPEIDPASVVTNLGMNITFVTTARNNEEAHAMLKLFGMPFKDKDN